MNIGTACPYCGHYGTETEGHYKGVHPDCVMEAKQRILDAHERGMKGLPPTLTRRERRAMERASKKKRP